MISSSEALHVKASCMVTVFVKDVYIRFGRRNNVEVGSHDEF